jgi:heme oxygenase
METSLVNSLRNVTQKLHKRAETTGVVEELIRGHVTLDAYLLYQRNLCAVYQTLEAELLRNQSRNGLTDLVRSDLMRYSSIKNDLNAITYGDWETTLPVLAATKRYLNQIKVASNEDSLAILGHYYVRYLGDLNGGQVLAKLLSKRLGLTAKQLSFYRFSEVENMTLYKKQLLSSLEKIGGQPEALERITHEAQQAFKCNIDLSIEVKVHSLGARTRDKERLAVSMC